MAHWQNENLADRAIRLAVAIAAAVAGAATHGNASIVWWVVTAIALISSITGFSLSYAIIGVRTRRK